MEGGGGGRGQRSYEAVYRRLLNRSNSRPANALADCEPWPQCSRVPRNSSSRNWIEIALASLSLAHCSLFRVWQKIDVTLIDRRVAIEVCLLPDCDNYRFFFSLPSSSLFFFFFHPLVTTVLTKQPLRCTIKYANRRHYRHLDDGSTW